MKRKFNLFAKLSPTKALFNAVDVKHPAVPNLDKVEAAIAFGADLNKVNAAGKTALVICAEKYARLMREEESIPLIRAIEGQANLVEGYFAEQAETFLKAGTKLIAAGADQRGVLQTLVAKAPLEAVRPFTDLLAKPVVPAPAPSIH